MHKSFMQQNCNPRVRAAPISPFSPCGEFSVPRSRLRPGSQAETRWATQPWIDHGTSRRGTWLRAGGSARLPGSNSVVHTIPMQVFPAEPRPIVTGQERTAGAGAGAGAATVAAPAVVVRVARRVAANGHQLLRQRLQAPQARAIPTDLTRCSTRASSSQNGR